MDERQIALLQQHYQQNADHDLKYLRQTIGFNKEIMKNLRLVLGNHAGRRKGKKTFLQQVHDLKLRFRNNLKIAAFCDRFSQIVDILQSLGFTVESKFELDLTTALLPYYDGLVFRGLLQMAPHIPPQCVVLGGRYDSLLNMHRAKHFSEKEMKHMVLGGIGLSVVVQNITK